jgi:hypothetical protein
MDSFRKGEPDVKVLRQPGRFTSNPIGSSKPSRFLPYSNALVKLFY